MKLCLQMNFQLLEISVWLCSLHLGVPMNASSSTVAVVGVATWLHASVATYIIHELLD